MAFFPSRTVVLVLLILLERNPVSSLDLDQALNRLALREQCSASAHQSQALSQLLETHRNQQLESQGMSEAVVQMAQAMTKLVQVAEDTKAFQNKMEQMAEEMKDFQNKTAEEMRASQSQMAEEMRAFQNKTAEEMRASQSQMAEEMRVFQNKTAEEMRASQSQMAEEMRAFQNQTAEEMRATQSQMAEETRASQSQMAEEMRASLLNQTFETTTKAALVEIFLTDRLSALQARLSAILQAAIQEIKADLSGFKADLNEFKADFTEFKAEVSTQISNLRSELTDQRTEINKLKVPSEAERVSDGLFLLVKEMKTWMEAKDNCRRMGGDLASPPSDFEAFKTFVSNELGRRVAWIGGRYEEESGVFTYLDGTHVQTQHWNQGEPDDRQPNSCVYINANYNPPLFDNICSASGYYICRFD